MASNIITENRRLPDEIKSILECPVCYVAPFKIETINICINGHYICLLCRLNVLLCPVCKSDQLDRHSPLLQKILFSLPECVNAYYGCQESYDDKIELNDHETNLCQFRKLDCLDFTCKQKVFFKDVIFHLSETHDGYTTKGGAKIKIKDHNFNKDSCWPPALIKFENHPEFDDHHFIFMFYTFKEGFFGMNAYIWGSITDAEKYMCKISMLNEDDIRYRSDNTSNIMPVGVPISERQNHCGNFTFSNGMLQKCRNSDDNVFFEFDVWKNDNRPIRKNRYLQIGTDRNRMDYSESNPESENEENKEKTKNKKKSVKRSKNKSNGSAAKSSPSSSKNSKASARKQGQNEIEKAAAKPQKAESESKRPRRKVAKK